MNYRLKDVVHEGAHGWVLRKWPTHFEVYHTGATHSTRKATYSGVPNALGRAVEHADCLDRWGRRSPCGTLPETPYVP